MDEIADGRIFVVDDITGADAVGGDDNLGMKSGAEVIDGDHGGAGESAVGVELLAEQHAASLERGMAVAADRVADDLGGDHWVNAEKLKN